MNTERVNAADSQSMVSGRFSGPVFIVGMPRSGTKLLRDLLNRSPQIGIPDIETHFFPLFINRFGRNPEFECRAVFDEIFAAFQNTNFSWHMARQGKMLNADQLIRLCREEWPAGEPISWNMLIEALIRYYAPPGRSPEFIWGDKTPDYLTSIQILKQVFPRARFLHIIRDPRDYCLSVRKTWGKSVKRAAQRWQKMVTTARSEGGAAGSDYLELKYESLLRDPSACLSEACRFLGCEFRSEMLRLLTPSEEYGDARGELGIVRNNQGKFRSELLHNEIQRIEEIVYPTMIEFGYEPECATNERRLSATHTKLLEIYDLYSLIRFYVRDKGFGDGLRYTWRAYLERGKSPAAGSSSK